MEVDKVFLVKVKNQDAKLNAIADGIIPLMKEYGISNYGEIDSFHYSEFFDNKKSFWFSVDDEINGFSILKILCEEFLTPIICLYKDKYYAFDSFGESITIPENCNNNYELVAAHVEEITGESFDSSAFNGSLEIDSTDNEDELGFGEFLTKEEKHKKIHIKPPTPEDFLKKCKEHDCEHPPIHDLPPIHDPHLKDNKKDKSTKVLKFKEPIIINNSDEFIKESELSSCEKTKTDESIKLESTANSSLILNNEFKSADSNYEKDKNDFKKIKLDEEEINLDELSSLLNSLEEDLVKDSNKQKDTDEKIVESLEEKVLYKEDLDDNGIEISQEELDEIIKNYEQQDEYLKKQKNFYEIDESIEPSIKPDFFDDISSLEIKDKNKNEENFEYSNVGKTEDIDLSYLDNRTSLKDSTLDDIKEGSIDLEGFKDDWHLPDEDIPVLFNKQTEAVILNLEDIKEELLEMENFDMNKNANWIDIEKDKTSLENDSTCTCECDLDKTKECTQKCECGCDIDDCKCNLDDSSKCECGCNVDECKCVEECYACNETDTDTITEFECCKTDGIDDEIKSNECCECSDKLEEINASEFECCDFVDTDSWDDEHINVDDQNENKYESLFKDVLEMENSEKNPTDFIFETNEPNDDLDFDNCTCDFESNEQDENQCDDSCICGNEEELEIKDDFQDIVDEHCDVCETLESKETIAENQCDDNCVCNNEEELEIKDDFQDIVDEHCDVCETLESKETIAESQCDDSCICDNEKELEIKDDFQDIVDEHCDVCETLESKETIAENIIEEEKLDSANIDLSSINDFDLDNEITEENLGLLLDDIKEEEVVDIKQDDFNNEITEENLGLLLDDIKEEVVDIKQDDFNNEITEENLGLLLDDIKEEVADVKQQDNFGLLFDDIDEIEYTENKEDDSYVPFYLEDDDILKNVKLDDNVIVDKQKFEKTTKLVDVDTDIKFDKNLIVDENLGLNLDDTFEIGQKDLILDDTFELDLSDSQPNLFNIDSIEEVELVDDKNAFDDSGIDLSFAADEITGEGKSSDFENTEDLPYVKIDSVANAMLGSLNEAKSSIKSNKDLVDELQRFLEELNIERKKLAEKKLIIAKRNEEAKRLFASNYGLNDFRNIK